MTANPQMYINDESTKQPFVWNVGFGLIEFGFIDTSPLCVILCPLPEKGRKETEEIVAEMKEIDREARGTGMKVKKQK